MPSIAVSIAETAASDSSPPFACPLCCVDKPLSAWTRLSQCSHESCRDCIVTWIEKAESSGQSTLPVCPFCRLALSPEETYSILGGRPFSPRTTTTTTSSSSLVAVVDELTRQWLEEQTQTCPGCGACIEKIPGGCDMMECLCGYRFCYACRSPLAQQCGCSPPDHYFWDNCFDRQGRRAAPPLAPKLGDAGAGAAVVDLKAHLAKRQRDEQGRLVRCERLYQRDLEQDEAWERTDESAHWLYRTKTRTATLRVLQHQLDGEFIGYSRALCSVEDDEDVVCTGIGAGRWLFRPREPTVFLSHYFSHSAVRLRARRVKARVNKSKALEGVDAAFASGKWLYYVKTTVGTYRQIKGFSKQQKNETAVQFDRWYFKMENDECYCEDIFSDHVGTCEVCALQVHDRAVTHRIFFLDKEAKAKELDEIQKHGL